MRNLLTVTCSLCAACANATPADGGADGGVTGDADESVGDGGDTPEDPRRGWIDLGSPPGAMAGDPSSPALTIWNGTPVVAYSADKHVRVYALETASTWVAVGGPLRNSTADNAVTYDPTPVVSADGLSVVWPEWSAGTMASPVRRTTGGGTWLSPPNMPALGAAGALSFLPRSSAAVDSDGAMWVAYSETPELNSPMRIHVASILGNDVVPRGSSISATNTNTGAIAQTIAAGGGSQFLAWSESGVRVAKRNASSGAWEAVGASPITVAGRAATSHHTPVLSADAMGRPLLGFISNDGSENGIYVARWDGAAWTYWAEMLQATPGMVMGGPTHPSLHDIAAAGPDVAYVTWTEADASGIDGVYVYRCAPAGCAPVGRGRLDPVAGDTRGATPKLAVDGAGRVLVTWIEDDAQGGAQVRVWRYHGDPDGP